MAVDTGTGADLLAAPGSCTRYGAVVADPAKLPRSFYVRFEAALPNDCRQADFTHFRLSNPDGAPGARVEILSWLDDCSRFLLSVTVQRRITGAIVVAGFQAAVARHGVPASTLTNSTAWSSPPACPGKGARNGFETELRRLGVVQKNSRPNHPTTCGKVALIAAPDRQSACCWVAVSRGWRGYPVAGCSARHCPGSPW